MYIKSKCWVIDHWVIFRLILGTYDNVITFLDTQSLLFVSEIELDFSIIPFELHGSGYSKNLLQYLANNNQIMDIKTDLSIVEESDEKDFLKKYNLKRIKS